jgi:hypothetical protein
MSGLLPANTTLQLGDNSGNIAHNGILASNVNGTSTYTTFPITDTSNNLGNYNHLGIDGQNNKKWDFLNMSGTYLGGYNWWNSNSTHAPQLLASLDANNGFKIETTNLTILRNIMNSSGLTIADDTNHNVNIISNSDISIRDLSNSNSSALNQYRLLINNDATHQSVSLNNQNIAFINGGIIKFVVNALDSPTLSLDDGTHNTQLTTTDLTFNSVSLQTTLNNLKIKQTNLINVYSSPAIYADGQPPLPVPSSSSNTYAQFGWYFKNTTAGYKINWYSPPATGMVVSDILGLYMRYFNCSTTNNGSSPFIIVYTKATGSGDAIPNFAHSVMVYIINTTPVANTSYTMFMNASGSCPTPSAYASNIQTMIPSPVNNPRGPYAPTESVLAFAIGTNSSSAVNSVEFIAQKLGIITSSGTQELSFMTLL